MRQTFGFFWVQVCRKRHITAAMVFQHTTHALLCKKMRMHTVMSAIYKGTTYSCNAPFAIAVCGEGFPWLAQLALLQDVKLLVQLW